MKSIFTSFLIILFTYSLNAQPTLTTSITPEIGDSWDVTFMEIQNFDTGATGANQTWDFSGLDLSNVIDISFEILDPASVLGQADFPTASFVVHLPAFELYEFYASSQNGISLVGGESISSGEIIFKTIFTNTEDALHFPINFGDSYGYDAHFEQYFSGNFLAENDRNGTVTADAYGTLITPNGTYSNILRIIIQETSFGETSTQYAWYDVNNFIPILLYETSSDSETPPTLYFVTNDITNATNAIPAEKSTWKAWSDHLSNQISIELPRFESTENVTLQLFDMEGRVLTSKDMLINGQTNNFTKLKVPENIICAHLVLHLKTSKGNSVKKVWFCK